MAPLCEWPGAHQKPVVDFLAETFRTKPLAHWMDYLSALDICFGPVNTLPEAIADANLQRGFMVTDGEGRLHFGPRRPLQERTKPALSRAAAGRAHGRSVEALAERSLAALGMTIMVLLTHNLR